MSCDLIQRELAGYHFGVIEDREQVERHLLCCPDCLQSFINLKRDIETADSGPAPSSEVLVRLRASAARELGIEAPRPWSWWERPLALAFGGVVTLVAIMAVGMLATGPGAPPRGSSELTMKAVHGAPPVGSARP